MKRDLYSLSLSLSLPVFSLSNSNPHSADLEVTLRTYPERVPVTKSVGELEKILLAREKAIREQQKDRGKTIEEIEREFLLVRDKMKRVSKDIKHFETTIEVLSKHFRKRHKKLQSLRNQVGNLVSNCFAINLSQRGYDGAAIFQHDSATKGRLDISVNMNPNSQASQSQDVNSFSGGETSFATVSLLLAMWEAMEPPFRIMDEFDVFMDDVHRTKSIDMLVEFARMYPFRQFIFLSPLDDKAIPRAPDIKIFKLHPPRTLGQRQITDYAAEK